MGFVCWQFDLCQSGWRVMLVRVEKPLQWAIVFKYFRQFKEKQWPSTLVIFAPRDPCHWAQCSPSGLFCQVITVVACPSGHVPMVKCFNVLTWRLNSKSLTLHTQWTVIEAFESNLCAIIQARKLGRTAALVSNLCPNASDSQSIGVSRKDNALRDSLCGTSSHRQSDSDDSPNDLQAWEIRSTAGRKVGLRQTNR